MRTALVMVQITVKDDARSDIELKRDVEQALNYGPTLSVLKYGTAAVVKVELDDAVQL